MQILSKTGKRPDDITLDAVTRGSISAEDIKISTETLNHQAQVARAAHRNALAENFERAGEMVNIPDETILRMYNLLRPNRAAKHELLAMADKLERDYHAARCAKLVREAVEVYEKRGILL